MYVGIDVTHPTANSGIDISIAAMVSNFDLAATRYTNEIFAQMAARETVERFEYQFRRLMIKFQKVPFDSTYRRLASTYCCLSRWCERFGDVADCFHRAKMHQARIYFLMLIFLNFMMLFFVMEMPPDSWTTLTHADPDLDVTYTYIVIQKRHITRFYQPSGKDDKGNATYVNVLSGTVIDNTVVSPKLFDFYLASQIGAIGTTRPAHYTVVVDEWMLSADQIYEMCYKLCFLYARCRIPVSLPCPVYYAHLVCEKAKEVYKTLNSRHEFDGVEELELRKNEIERRLAVHEAYPGMHFV
ncbi:piwi domain protein [Oesophagostomum dentatum]|uniref:Piwi domain protein n=1 Tax=Oesophagostomum dentatum TaxID=61180 RepID=A0A0B1SQ63_OESDE|nr:piwi domain protein [Oesophagostomum dentatum]